jgi:hypothetical protein
MTSSIKYTEMAKFVIEASNTKYPPVTEDEALQAERCLNRLQMAMPLTRSQGADLERTYKRIKQ